ncbi:MAG: Gfo/Idh/MocA family oxidoreductase [Planctomycetes bacterium]|nr:Gfo/Idh/MocA family oxidoreductase [Planctomycetota bacterium]
MSSVRIGIIGCGGISGHHLESLSALKDADFQVTAYCDVNAEAAEARRKEFGSGGEPVFTDYVKLLESGLVDAVLISTPHPAHPDAAVAAFEHGIHVVCEKPVAVTVRDALRINEAQEKSGCVYTVHLQRRHMPKYRWIKEQIDAGLIGRVHKVNATWTDWYRSQTYYNSGTWRGTWNGEGGGVLMNQCPHDLDLFTWWLGLPESVDARIWLGHFHDVEIEDEIVANLTFEGGGIGILNASTCDAPGVTRWEILGENGGISISGDTVTAFSREKSLSDYTKNTDEMWAAPPVVPIEVNIPETVNVAGAQVKCAAGTQAMWLDFLAAIRGEKQIYMDGREGVKSIELANAIIASGYLGSPVELPLDAGVYDGVLADLRAGKTGCAIVNK